MKKKEPILYVDDEDVNLLLFDFNFKADYSVFTAMSAEEGFKILQNNEIKVVISDQRMQGKTGIEFFEEISDSFPDVIRILLTAYSESEVLLDSINKGEVYKFIRKPWNYDDMNITLKNAVETFDLKHQNMQLINSLKKYTNELEKINTKLLKEIKTRKETEDALINSEKKFRNLFNSSIDLIIILNFENKILELNAAFEDLLKYKKTEIIGKKIDCIIHSEDFSLFQEKTTSLKTRHSFSAFELRLLACNNEIFLVEINSRVIDYDGSKAILFIARNINERKETENKLLYAIIDTEEKERQHFAEELHDGLGPLISSMKLNLYFLKENRNGKKADTALENLFEIIDESILNIKEISNQLSPYILMDFGLLPAIKSFCNKIKSHENIEININDKMGDIILNDKNKVIIYRVFTELINNTFKHAYATKIDISFSVKNGFLKAIYKDNGKGFDLHGLINNDKIGFGLFNIRNRLKLIGCEFNMTSEKDNGFILNFKYKL